MAYSDYTVGSELTTPMTDAQFQQLALDECNVLADPKISASAVTNMPLWWAMYQEKGQFLTYWYCRRAICAYLLSSYRKKRTMKIGADMFKNEDLITNIQAMLEFAQEEINRLDPIYGDFVESFSPNVSPELMPDTIMHEIDVIGSDYGFTFDYPYSYQP